MRFIAPASISPPLRVYFEPEVNRLPKYDLARKLHQRSIDDFSTLGHGALSANPGFQLAPEPISERIPYLLYIGVGLLVVLLGFYIARTVQAGIPSETSPD